MSFWINFIGFQIVWFAAVVGAGKGLWWPGPVAALVFVVAHLLSPLRRRGDGALVLIALLLGAVIDSTYATGGILRYAAPFPSAQLAPLWILALWAAFALSLNHSLAWLTRNQWIAGLTGAFVGPMSYWSAGRAFGAVSLGEPLWQSLLALSIGWMVAMTGLSLLARRFRGSDSEALPKLTSKEAA